jgi:hypothetical protein
LKPAWLRPNTEAARLLASMAQLGLQRPCAGVSAAMVEDCKRPDAAATLFIQLVENQASAAASACRPCHAFG